ncbi:hypothetical protein PV328_001976 [Microctonus aethiopoides]|uniref:Ionotropic receptor n=1 Tax=Microctonus aethiopoides TaxID=144406 RepID=A0AA39KY65_9HYME|nr:hypothetical protein PV328_001976 [Microctonus aethiopoides]
MEFHRYSFVFFGLLLPTVTLGNGILAKLAKDYFENLIITQIVVFGCWDLPQRLEFYQSVMQMKNRLTYVNIQPGLSMGKILKVNYYKLGIVLDLDCPHSEIIFDQQHLRHNESYFWLMPMSKFTKIPNYFNQLPLNIATEMTLALLNNNNVSYTLYDIYNPSYRHGGKLNVTYMGHWSVKDGIKIELTQYKYKRRGNLHGLVLNASIVIDHPPVPDYITYIHNPINPHLDTMHRYNYALTLQLRDYYNFTMNLSRGKTWGYLVNGTFNGILGDMVKGIIDFGATPFQYKPERLDVCEYTVQTWLARPCFIFRHPKKNNLSNPFLKPFEMDVWFWIAIFGFVNYLLLYMTSKIEKILDRKPPVNTLDTHPASECALIASAAICQQGLSDGPRIYSGRIVFMSLFLWGLMLYQFYSASVVGSLLAKKPRWINTLKDLADSSLEIGIEDIAYNYDFFATTSDPVALQLYREKIAVNKKRKKSPYFTVEEGIRKMQKGGFAFHVDVATAYKIIEETFDVDEICDLVEIQLFPPKHTATATSRHSPFKKMVTYGMRQVVEHGMAKRLRNIWMHRRPECPESHSADPVPVVLEEFSPALFLLVCGVICALIAMLIEMHFIRRNRIKMMNTDDDDDDRLDSEINENHAEKTTPSTTSLHSNTAEK